MSFNTNRIQSLHNVKKCITKIMLDIFCNSKININVNKLLTVIDNVQAS
jgi:hypothetical protein